LILQVGCYDHVKQMLKSGTGMREGFATHVTAAMISGLLTSTASSPLDVVKTRIQAGEAPRAVMRGIAGEGARGLFRGWLPN
jgi:dicarboxylate transporter 10